MSKYEEQIAKILKFNGIRYRREKTFQDLKHGLLRYDFYIDNLEGEEIIIEEDGPFHFEPITGRLELMKQQEYDRIKNSYCLAYCIKLYRIPYWDMSKIKNINDIFQEKYRVKSRWHNDEIWRKHRKEE